MEFVIFGIILFCSAFVFSLSGCEDGIYFCKDNETAAKCVGNTWEYEECEFGCVYGKCAQCEENFSACLDDGSGYVMCTDIGILSPPVYCTDGPFCRDGECYAKGEQSCSVAGETKCKGRPKIYSNPNLNRTAMVQFCDYGKNWRDLIECEIDCNAGVCEELDYENKTKKCFSNISYREYKSGGEWGNDAVCTVGRYCIEGECKMDTECEVGERRCILNEVWECEKGGWMFVKKCMLDNYCLQAFDGTGCFSESKKCWGWSEWEILSEEEILEKDWYGRERECLKISLKRECLNADGSKNNEIFEERKEFDCEGFEEKCEYLLNSSEKIMKWEGEMCAVCEKKIFSYVCEPGKIIEEMRMVNESCEEFVECAGNETGREILQEEEEDNLLGN
ncbi:MAG: hypothetical protein ABIH83_02745, partial [Candidatus Micrarchaeota archaeon]